MNEVITEQEAVSAPVQQRAGLTIEQARDVLDWLEMHGAQSVEVEADEAGLLNVRWRGDFR